jgi:hypothetical protein
MSRGATSARSALVCHRQTANQGLQPMLCQNTPENTRDCSLAFAAWPDEQDAGVSARYEPTYIREIKV